MRKKHPKKGAFFLVKKIIYLLLAFTNYNMD